MRGGDHHTQVCPRRRRQVGNGWGGKNAEIEHVDSGGRETGSHGSTEKLTRGSGIAAHNGAGPMVGLPEQTGRF